MRVRVGSSSEMANCFTIPSRLLAVQKVASWPWLNHGDENLREGKRCVVAQHAWQGPTAPLHPGAENDHGQAWSLAAIPLTVIAIPGCTVPPSLADSDTLVE